MSGPYRCLGAGVWAVKSICVFCGSSSGNDPLYEGAGREVGKTLAQRGIQVVYGGASVGVMGAVADGAMAAGGKVVGVIPKAITEFEVSHTAITELHVVDTMHTRKAMMADLSDAFISLPGGIGTMEEFFEVWTWGQLGYHDKPFGLLDVGGYWDPLETMLDSMVDKGFLRPMHRAMVFNETSLEVLLERFDSYAPPNRDKWISSRGL
ncbi:MAG: TIGR00730 family Rossman fold protein [Pseudomonadota bacterium]